MVVVTVVVSDVELVVRVVDVVVCVVVVVVVVLDVLLDFFVLVVVLATVVVEVGALVVSTESVVLVVLVGVSLEVLDVLVFVAVTNMVLDVSDGSTMLVGKSDVMASGTKKVVQSRGHTSIAASLRPVFFPRLHTAVLSDMVLSTSFIASTTRYSSSSSSLLATKDKCINSKGSNTVAMRTHLNRNEPTTCTCLNMLEPRAA
mmetsp:Transcript_86583/g.218326  ORF Transcript_86583/g.218326 Transcript_86583/m.218326 type:complete len:202 (+) Transcript_86583:847-1452(+)